MFCPKCGSQNNDNAQFCMKCGNRLNGGAAPNMGQGPVPGAQTGLQKNVAALLSYIAGWITGLIFFFIEKDKFVRFHAMQSILTFGALSVLQILISIISVAAAASFTGGGFAVFSILSILSTIIWIGTLGLWILLMVKAYQNQWFKLPVVGDMAEKYSK
jgi:uncharacterized membrane protein